MVPTMARFFWPVVAVAGGLAALAGCSGFDYRERPAWRTHAEDACLAQNLVHESAFIQPFHELNGPGICGLHHPFKVRGLANGTVTLNATETLDCSMIPALDSWITTVLQPAALARFGEPVVEIKTMGSYNCRGINNQSGASLSEHSFGNAMDVGGFMLRSGRELNIMRGWKGGDEQELAFLHEAHAGACGMFTTVLGPGSNAFHYNHFHLDLAMHGNSSRGPRRICKPVPSQSLPEAPRQDTLPEPPSIDEEIDMARAPSPAQTATEPGMRSYLATATPAVAESYRPALPSRPVSQSDKQQFDAIAAAAAGSPSPAWTGDPSETAPDPTVGGQW